MERVLPCIMHGGRVRLLGFELFGLSSYSPHSSPLLAAGRQSSREKPGKKSFMSGE